MKDECMRGHRRGKNGACAECRRLRNKKYRESEKYRAKNRRTKERRNAETRAYYATAWGLLSKARYRAKKGGYACTITAADIIIPEFCPLLGTKLQRGTGRGGAAASSPSLDKIKPQLGYVPGNVWVISQRANTMKSDATLEEMQMLVTNWVRHTTNSGLPNQ